MGVIIFAMILHIINAARSKDIEGTLFDVNGVAGLVFYASVVATIVLFMTGHKTPGAVVLAVMFGVPLLLILFKEPLTKKIQKRADKMEESKAMFLVQGFFELFETIAQLFFQYTFLCPYRSICCQSCSDDGSSIDACRS